MRKHLGFAMSLLALGLFFPGILLPMIDLSMEMAANMSGSALTASLVDKELSIMATVKELWQDERLLVAALIFAFSVAVPLVKTSLIFLAYIKRSSALEKSCINFVGAIGKWSMADVFVVAIFLAILSTNHADTSAIHQLSVFGFNLSLNISTQTLSAVGQGFYYFTGYCLLSLAGTHIYQTSVQE